MLQRAVLPGGLRVLGRQGTHRPPPGVLERRLRDRAWDGAEVTNAIACRVLRTGGDAGG
jgi:hypothetical protein